LKHYTYSEPTKSVVVCVCIPLKGLDTPKSAIFGSIFLSRITLAGFRSRWKMGACNPLWR